MFFAILWKIFSISFSTLWGKKNKTFFPLLPHPALVACTAALFRFRVAMPQHWTSVTKFTERSRVRAAQLADITDDWDSFQRDYKDRLCARSLARLIPCTRSWSLVNYLENFLLIVSSPRSWSMVCFQFLCQFHYVMYAHVLFSCVRYLCLCFRAL